MAVMLTLMRKDWRLFRAPVVGTIVFGGAPYVLALLADLVGCIRQRSLLAAPNVLETGAIASCASLICLAAVAGVFGGMAWAAERANRSADFLALLPPARWQQAVSKVAVAAGCLAACVAADVAVGVTATRLFNRATHANMDVPVTDLWFTTGIGCYGVMAFSVAWGCSAVLSSSAISAVVGICSGIALYAVIVLTDASRHGPAGLWVVVSLSLGTLAFLAGAARQLVRVEP